MRGKRRGEREHAEDDHRPEAVATQAAPAPTPRAMAAEPQRRRGARGSRTRTPEDGSAKRPESQSGPLVVEVPHRLRPLLGGGRVSACPCPRNARAQDSTFTPGAISTFAKRSFISRTCRPARLWRITRSPLASSPSVCLLLRADRVLQNMKSRSGTIISSITHMPPPGGSEGAACAGPGPGCG